MNCPTCTDERLVLAERSGIEIDYCPSCRGVWLDRGELDKLIERSSATALPAPPPSAMRVDDRDRSGKDKPKKKSSFLSELFEF